MKPPFFHFIVSLGLVAFGLTSALGALHLTEFMADNGGSLQDEDGDASDWIEVFNSGPIAVTLDGYKLTDDATAQT